MTSQSLRKTMTELYEGSTDRAHRFRYVLFFIDLAVVVFIVATSFLPRTLLLAVIDILVGLLVLGDLMTRLWISENRRRDVFHWTTWVDVIAVASFLLPIGDEGAGFLRVLRTLRLLHTYQMLNRLRLDSPYFRRHEDIVLATTHLLVFLFIMTGAVYETQYRANPHIANYADALYFTVTALTTTGFGDITLPGTLGRLLSVIIMLFGVTLFLRLAQVLFRPNKVRFPCPSCGLQRHEPDAVHCKACGLLLNIPDDND